MRADSASPISGEAIAHEEAGTRVRLDGGRLGLLPRSSGANLDIGVRGHFRIERSGSEGELILAIATPSGEPPLHSFDQEFDRLHNVLANHGPHGIYKSTPDETLGEKRIEQWMERVNDTVARLRKRRARRLNSQT